MRTRTVVIYGLFLGAGVIGCKDLTGAPGLPAGTPNPSFYNTPTGAVGMRNAAVFQFERAMQRYLIETGLLTDELQDLRTGAGTSKLFPSTSVSNPLDERILPEGGDVKSYEVLQQARGFIDQALGALAAYDTVAKDTASSRVLRGELEAMEGMTEIMLADFFCSGVPLSTLDFRGDFTYAPSSTTTQVYHAALAKFDTALALAGASDSVRYLARIGQGRAYLDLGQYAAATDDVSTVPDGFAYTIAVALIPGYVDGVCQLATNSSSSNCTGTESDREGGTGLPYRSSGDPRTAGVYTTKYSNPSFPSGDSLFFPAKYRVALTAGYTPFTVASGVEARLIQAEAALSGGDVAQWLTILNALRVSSQADSATLVDTLGVTAVLYSPLGILINQTVDSVWNAAHTRVTATYTVNTYRHPVWLPGSGGISGLYPITDPGDPVARIDTMFTERAAWLFMTGARQGDLRRLLRQYGQYPAFQSQDQVYPTGFYLAPGPGYYGTDVTAPISPSEYANDLFHGCLDRLP